MDIDTSDAYRAIEELLDGYSRPVAEIRSILENNSRVVLEQDENRESLLHHAIDYGFRSSLEYCRVLLEFDPTRESLQLRNFDGDLPFHLACSRSNLEMARYLVEIHPGGINETDIDGCNCLHILLGAPKFSFQGSERLIELMGFLLKNAPGLISAAARNGNLPLHVACRGGHGLCVIQFLYNACPEAINMGNSRGDTPLNEAIYTAGSRGSLDEAYFSDGFEDDEQDPVISFLRNQLAIVNEARNVTTPDERGQGQLPIHRAMLNVNLPVGTLKLMIDANPQSVLIADRLGQIPLHIACQHCAIDIIKCLVGAHQDTLLIPDSSGDLPLHITCLYGRLGVVEWILDGAVSGVSVENNQGKLPIEMLLYEANCDRKSRKSLEYVQAVHALIRAHPESVSHLIA
jgi:ankyrin repeat protein